MIRRLQELIAPLSEREFLDGFARKRRLIMKTTRPERASSLLPWPAINALIARMPSSSVLLVVKGNAVDEMMYRSGRRGRLRLEALHQLAAQGVSVVLNDIHRYAPSINTLANAIERRLNHSVDVNCYITFGIASAFKPHADTHDVLIVQVHGAKRWRGYGVPVAFPLEDFPSEVERKNIVYGRQCI